MNEAIRTEQYKGYKISFYQDEDSESPREWDNLGKMICFHRKYILGDKHNMRVEELEAMMQRKDIVSLPLYLIDHSGISINTVRFSDCDSQKWDWGQVGHIYVDLDTIRKEYNVKHVTKNKRDLVLKVLQGEVENYDKYLRREVYGYIITDSKGEQTDSCWGFYDEFENTLKECQQIIDKEKDNGKEN